MANIKELRGRIKSVGGIAKITGAMEMVASMKLRKVQANAMALQPYTHELTHLIDHLAANVGGDAQLPLFQKRQVKTTGVLIVSSDRGLCGAYNTNLLAEFHKLETQKKKDDPQRKFKMFCYGRKGYSYLHRRGYDIERFFVDPPLDNADFLAAKMVGKALVEAFEAGTVDEVYVLSTAFKTMVRFVPRATPFLPVGSIATGDEAETGHNQNVDYLLEPDAETLFNRLIPRYLETVIFDAMLESLASEHASRRIAMKGASDSAVRMTKDLKRVYNRARQESITKELLDIIGGASAVS